MLAEVGAIRGRVLDVCCGAGEHALMAAELGGTTTGVDLAVNTLCTAGRKARERGLTATFLRHDARRLSELAPSFDMVPACGLFHIFTGDDQTAHLRSLCSVLPPGGRHLMLGPRDQQPSGWERHRLILQGITGAFADGGWKQSNRPS